MHVILLIMVLSIYYNTFYEQGYDLCFYKKISQGIDP
jgi:hypothetical protein